jgi:hypothetical protein
VIASIVHSQTSNYKCQGDSNVSKSRAKIDSRDDGCFQHHMNFLLQPDRARGFGPTETKIQGR